MTDIPIACTLTADQLRCAAADLLPGLAARAQVVRPVPDGARLEFVAAPGLVVEIAAVIERERQCCRFLRFALEVSPATGPVTLDLSGPPGTGAFLASLDRAFASPTG